VCEAIRSYAQKDGQPACIDVHLMVEPVDRIIPDFAKAGANLISFHPEASTHIDRTIGLIKEVGCQSGLVFNPATPLHFLDFVLDKIDLVLLMSVNPGFGGQQFIPSTLDKIVQTRKILDAYTQKSGRKIRLEVDGGINVTNIGSIHAAGADTFVAGSAIFGKPDYAHTISEMRQALASNQ
jgi:ribulose-phosphate 3-epimerase